MAVWLRQWHKYCEEEPQWTAEGLLGEVPVRLDLIGDSHDAPTPPRTLSMSEFQDM